MKSRISTDYLTDDHVTAQAETSRPLVIKLSEDPRPPTHEHQLLLGFHFGTEPTRYDHPAIISLRLQPLDRDQLFESWWYKGEVEFSDSGPVKIAECADYTVAIVQRETIASEGFRKQTCDAYRELLAAVRSTQHTKLVKVWNYFDDINLGDGDSEKYRQFSIGRAEAFKDLGINDEDAPTGTAIGTQSDSGLTLIALASNRYFCPVENPRQISAFHYPRKYGPSSPKFSRGGFVSSKKHKLFLISGTAAVVGHESNSPYNTCLQTDETFENLAYLCEAISGLDPDGCQFSLDEQSVLRVYLKNPADFHPVKQKMDKKMRVSSQNIVFLHGTICREELMVEIDGVKVT